MSRRPAILATLLLVLGATTPALAQTAIPCRIGQHAKDGHLLVERFAMRVNEAEDRTEYVVRVRNPHPWPALVLAGVALPGLVDPPAEPVLVPPRGVATVPLAWFPLSMSVRRMAPPSVDEVRAAMMVPFCEVLGPAPAQPAEAPSASLAITPGGVEVVRDERPHQRLQRL